MAVSVSFSHTTASKEEGASLPSLRPLLLSSRSTTPTGTEAMLQPRRTYEEAALAAPSTAALMERITLCLT